MEKSITGEQMRQAEIVVAKMEIEIRKLKAELAKYHAFGLSGISDLQDRAEKAEAALKAQAEQIWATKENFRQSVVIVDNSWTFSDSQQPTANWHDKQECMELIRALLKPIHPPTKSERLALADSEVLRTAINLYNSGYDEESDGYFVAAIDRRAAILKENE